MDKKLKFWSILSLYFQKCKKIEIFFEKIKINLKFFWRMKNPILLSLPINYHKNYCTSTNCFCQNQSLWKIINLYENISAFLSNPGSIGAECTFSKHNLYAIQLPWTTTYIQFIKKEVRHCFIHTLFQTVYQ